MRLLLCTMLLACSSSEYRVLLDGEPVEGLAAAAEAAGPGSLIELEPGTYAGGVFLRDGVTLRGPGAVIQGGERVLTGEGDLILEGIELVGGSEQEGSAVWAEGLKLEDVTQSGATGQIAIFAHREIEVHGLTSSHADVAIQAVSPLGRARRVILESVVSDGHLIVEGDTAQLMDVEARQITTGGPDTRIEGSHAGALSVRGRVANIFQTDIDLVAVVSVDTQQIGDVGGGTWALDGERVYLAGLDAGVLSVEGTEEVVLVDAYAHDRLVATCEDEIQLLNVGSALLSASAPAVSGTSVSAPSLTLEGVGNHHLLTAAGREASLRIVGGRIEDAIVWAQDARASLSLEAAEATNLLVVESIAGFGEAVVDTHSYATVRRSTFLVGSRVRVVPEEIPVLFQESIVYGSALGELGNRTTWEGTVVWSETESLLPRTGVLLADPDFLNAGDPIPHPDSAWQDVGAFSGPGGPAVRTRWALLKTSL